MSFDENGIGSMPPPPDAPHLMRSRTHDLRYGITAAERYRDRFGIGAPGFWWQGSPAAWEHPMEQAISEGR